MAQVGEIVYQVQMDVAQLLTSQRQLDQRLRNMEGGFDRTTRSVNDTENAMFSLSKTAALVTSALSAGAIIHAVDEWGQMAARIKMALNSVEGDVERYSEIQKRFLEVSNRNGKAIETVQALYAGSATSMKELGYNTTQTVDYIESLSSAFTANATGAQQTESAMSSLNRAMVVGTLKGNDWHAVLNATPSVVSDIAKELSRLRGGVKVTENDVKKMAMETGISMKLFADSMINARKENNALADSMDNTVADGFTKLTNSAKAYYGELNQAYGVTRSMSAAFADITANFDTFANIANVVALVVGARLVGAFSASVKAKILDVAASAKQSQAYAATARAAEYAATAERRKAFADKDATASAVALAQVEYQVARGSAAEATALDNLNAKKTVARNASIAYAQSLTAEAAASQVATVAANKASVAMGVARSALSLIGGPMGFAMLAGAGMMYFSESMKQARKEAADFADSLGDVSAKLKEINYDALNAAIGKTNQQMAVQEETVSRLRDELDALDKKLLGVKVSTFTAAGEEKKRAEILDEVRIKTGELREATDRLSAMKKFLAQAAAEVNARVSESEKIFGGASDGAGKMANAVQWLASQIRKAAGEQANLNSEIAGMPRSQEGDDYIRQLKEQNILLSEQDKRKRAIKQAELEAGKKTENVDQINEAKALAGANYDIAEAERERASTGKKSASDALKSANAVADALKNQQAAVDRLNTGYKEGSLELAKYDAVMALGSEATEAQVTKAKELAEATWKASQAVKDLAQAEQGRKFATQEIAAAKVAINPDTDKAEDPLAQVNLQEQQKLEALARYQAIDLENADLYEDAKTAIMEQAAYERRRISEDESEKQRQNMLKLLGSTSDLFGEMAGAVGDYAGESSDAYRALFAVSKGFAIAQGLINLQTAIGNAMALPWPLNVPAIAAAAAAGANVISSIRGVNYSGARFQGGPVDAGSMYRVGEGGKPEIFRASDGKQFMIPGDNGRVISNKDMGGDGGGSQVIINIQNYSSASVDARARDTGNGVTIDMIVADISQGGNISQAIERSHQAPRRATE